jgi:hypothetical protein
MKIHNNKMGFLDYGIQLEFNFEQNTTLKYVEEFKILANKGRNRKWTEDKLIDEIKKYNDRVANDGARDRGEEELR